MGSINWIKDNGQPITTNDRQATIEYAESIGWARENESNSESAPNVDGDKGSGIPGTKEWHESAIRGMSTKLEIAEYLKELGIKVNQQGNLDTIKNKAVNAIEALEDDNSTADS